MHSAMPMAMIRHQFAKRVGSICLDDVPAGQRHRHADAADDDPAVIDMKIEISGFSMVMIEASANGSAQPAHDKSEGYSFP